MTSTAGEAAGGDRLGREEAERLGQRIQAHAAMVAESMCELLLMLAEFEARGGLDWFYGFKSTAHWLAWACSMDPGTAREHVRVARALPGLPLTVEEFRAGRLSYSKVREIARVADQVEETQLVEMARAMTAAQLARTISAFRAVDGSRLSQDAVREASWRSREDGMVEIRAVLPADVGAEVITAMELALQRDGHTPENPHTTSTTADPEQPAPANDAQEGTSEGTPGDVREVPTLGQRRADALQDLARTYLHAQPDDRSGEDRHLVIVNVDADTLATNVPAGTSQEPEDVPAGTPGRCGVLDQGPLEPATAERLACTGKVAVMITDRGGEVLHLGRARRLASPGQRRALRLRDQVCVFPGCHQSRHLDAHHTTPWSEGGTTDIEHLALLCRRHHVMVHEGGLRLIRAPQETRGRARAVSTPGVRFRVVDQEGQPIEAHWPSMLEHIHTRPSSPHGDTTEPRDTGPQSDTSPDRIASTTGGAGFRLADCVDALCHAALTTAA